MTVIMSFGTKAYVPLEKYQKLEEENQKLREELLDKDFKLLHLQWIVPENLERLVRYYPDKGWYHCAICGRIYVWNTSKEYRHATGCPIMEIEK